MLHHRLSTLLLFFTIITLNACLKQEEALEVKDNLVSAAAREDWGMVRMFLSQNENVDMTDDILRTPIMFASAAANNEVVERLLYAGASQFLKDRAGRNALTHAVRGGSIELVELLIKHGGDLTQLDSSQRTLLMHAAELNRIEMIEYLLQKGANLEAVSFSGNRALMYAAESNHLKTVEYLLDRGAQIDAVDDYGATALSFAVDFGHYETAKMLLERGADINVSSNYENTLLTSAVHYSTVEMVKLLLDYGADPGIKDRDRKKVYFYAHEKGNYRMAELLKERGADTSQFRHAYSDDDIYYIAVRYGLSLQYVQKMLKEKRGEFNYKDEHQGRTALIESNFSFYADKFYTVKLLLENGADTEIKDDKGNTALYYAVKHNVVCNIALLVSSGADVSDKAILDESWARPKVNRLLKLAASRRVSLEEAAGILDIEFNIAVYNNDLEQVKKHIEGGADADSWSDGVTPLMIAANNGNMEMVKYLLSKGADSSNQAYKIDYSGERGPKAIDYAMKKGYFEIVHLLLKDNPNSELEDRETPLTYLASSNNIVGLNYFLSQGYDINEAASGSNDKHEPPLMTAIRSESYSDNYLATIELLIKYGADVNYRKFNESTPLMLAVTNRPRDIMTTLLEAGALINLVDDYGYSALTHAVLSGNYEGVELLLEEGAHTHLLSENYQSMVDLGYKYPAITKLLLERGVKIDALKPAMFGRIESTFMASLNNHSDYTDRYQRPEVREPLRYDSEFDNRPLPTFKMLHEHGADPYMGFGLKYSPFVRAYKQRNRVAMRFLVEMGYPPSLDNSSDLLIPLLKEEKKDIVKMLIQAGADVNLYDEKGYTPLIRAIDDNDLELVTILIKGGADPNKPHKSYGPPIKDAIFTDNLQMVKILVDSGAETNIEVTHFKKEYTLINFAEEYGTEEIVEYLKLF